MGHPTGFQQHERVLPSKRPVSDRLQDYKEFVLPFAPKTLSEQSARCMDCGIPFCQSGCPLGNLVPEFNDAVYAEKWETAFHLLKQTNNFPEFTGRICPAPCESACVLGLNQSPVTIEEIEKHIIEKAFDQGWEKPHAPVLRSGKKIAIVGAGPAGLAAADQLNQAGHSVTVFERDEAPGGLLRYGIPDFKLEKGVVERRIQLMQAAGIVFQCNTAIGKDVRVDELLRSYQAIVLSVGSTIPRDLSVPGRQLKGIDFAMHFLKGQNQVVAGQRDQNPCAVKGKKVVVIGGGDTGSDCIGTANRLGAASVLQLEILPMPPRQRTAHMPWPEYPLLLKETSSHEEGADRKWAVATKAFLGNEAGQLVGLELVSLEWALGPDGKTTGFQEIPGSNTIIPCDQVFLALGFLHADPDGPIQDLALATDARGNVLANAKDYQTSLPKVFACGDARRGQSLVVWAISEGRECARAVDLYLMGHSRLPSKVKNKILNYI